MAKAMTDSNPTMVLNNRVLVADADLQSRFHFRALLGGIDEGEGQPSLSRISMQVEVFDDGQQLVDYFRTEMQQQRRIPICLLDEQQLPVNNLRTAELLRAIDPDVIVMVVLSETHVVGEKLWRLLDQDIYYTKKPFIDQEMLALVAYLLRSWNRQQHLAQNVARMKQEAALLHALMDNLPDAIYFKDAQTRFLRVNQGWRTVVGVPAEVDVSGKTDFDVHVPELAADFYAEEVDLLRSGVPIVEREEYHAGASEQRWYAATKGPIRDEAGNITGLVGITRDITTHKQAELALRTALTKEQELNELRARLMAIISHELRTPLATMQAACDGILMFMERMSPEEIRGRLDKIQQQIKHMTALHNDVLLLSTVESRTVALHPQPLDFITLVRDLIDALVINDEDKHHVALETPVTSLPIVGYDSLLRQIITNLLSNALKYSPTNTSVSVQITTTGEDFTICIADEGIGIPESDLPNLFQVFHRGSNVGAVSGTGLGLAITWAAVQRHQGSIDLASHAEIGTQVTVTLPRIVSAEDGQ